MIKLFFIIGGLFILIFICIIPFKRDIQEYNVQKNGELVVVTITHLRNCIGGKIKYFMEFTYAGQKFEKKIGCAYAEAHRIGDTIRLKHIKSTDIFLFGNETKKGEFISTVLLALLGITFIFIGLKQK